MRALIGSAKEAAIFEMEPKNIVSPENKHINSIHKSISLQLRAEHTMISARDPKIVSKRNSKANAAPTLTNKIFEALNRVFHLSSVSDQSFESQPSIKLERVLENGIESFLVECQNDDYLTNLPEGKLRSLFSTEFLLEKVAEKLQPKQRKRGERGPGRSDMLLSVGDDENDNEYTEGESSQAGIKRKRGRRPKGQPVVTENSVTTKKKQLRLRLQTLEEKIRDVLLLKNDLCDSINNSEYIPHRTGNGNDTQYSNNGASATANLGIQESANSISGMAVPLSLGGLMPMVPVALPPPMLRLAAASSGDGGGAHSAERLAELAIDIAHKEVELFSLYRERVKLERATAANSQQSKILILGMDPTGEPFLKGMFHATVGISDTEKLRAEAWVELSKACWCTPGRANTGNDDNE